MTSEKLVRLSLMKSESTRILRYVIVVIAFLDRFTGRAELIDRTVRAVRLTDKTAAPAVPD